MTYDVAIVTGTYNRLEMLRRSVDSIRRAVGGHRHVIIPVDGGSTDGTREWMSEQSDVLAVLQDSGQLTGAVPAFNAGFAEAVRLGVLQVVHLNDDAEFVGDLAIDRAMKLLNSNGDIGEVAFEFDLRGGWQLEQVHNRIYGNFGLIRTEAGIAVAKAQGDESGTAWWNPIYRTYGADCEFGCWLWHLGWRVVAGHGLRVHDMNCQDVLRQTNECWNPNRRDSRLFWARWPEASNIEKGPVPCVEL